MTRSSKVFGPKLLMIGLLLWGLALVGGCGRSDRHSEGNGPLKVVTLQLNWFPEHEHGGFYAAMLHGYYREQGLDVRIVAGGPKVAVAHQLVTGRADFAIAGADEVLLARAQQAMLVAVLAPLETSPRCIMVHKSSGIESLDDLRGTIALKGGSPFVEFLERNGYLDECQVVPFFGGIGRFVSDKNFSQQAYSFSEPLLARRQKSDPHVLMLSDKGFNPYAGMLVTLSSTLEKDPDMVRKFTRASLQGWRKYLAEPESTNIHLAKINDSLDADLLAEGVEALRELCRDPDSPALGEMDLGRWQALGDQLEQLGLIGSEQVDPVSAFSNDYLR
jgi:NitT/TauT family transport system substrate-binding protein